MDDCRGEVGSKGGGAVSDVDPTTNGKVPLISDQSKFTECLRELILQNKIEEPLVFRKMHDDWVPCKWTLGDWGDIFRDEKLSVRYGRQKWDCESPQWESLCGNLEITWTKLIEWVRGECNLPVPNSTPNDIWMYYDYKYLPEVIHLKSEAEKDFLKLIYLSENLKKKFCWNKLGFPERNGDHSTLWIGTAGSYTNAHFDTYSSNLVCQVYGRKTWLVFPPNNTDYLHATRVPYEESSVYSRLNFASREQLLKHMSDLKRCSPRKITLEPGDCLYLPPKWWHYVKSEDLSISVNTWIELPCDHFTRVEEAVLRAVVACVVNSSVPSTADKILNPNEVDLTEIGEKDTEETLRVAAKSYFEYQKSDPSSVQPDTSHKSFPKRIKLNSDEITLEYLMQHATAQVEKLPFYNLEADILSQDHVPSSPEGQGSSPVSRSRQHSGETSDGNRPNRSPTLFEDVLNAVGHPEILKQIAEKFLNNVKQRNTYD